MTLRPATLREANAFVAEHHSHHEPVRGCKFAIACLDGSRLCGVVIVERPKARVGLIEAMEKAKTACGCQTLKPAPPTPCEPCAIIDAALVKYRR